MNLIPPGVHGVIDYAMGFLLIAAPWLFGFAYGGAETWVPVLLGAGAIGYNLLTRYELGAIRLISMRTHLTLDLASGILLARSPELFQFEKIVGWPHVVLGLLAVGVALMTQRTSHNAIPRPVSTADGLPTSEPRDATFRRAFPRIIAAEGVFAMTMFNETRADPEKASSPGRSSSRRPSCQRIRSSGPPPGRSARRSR